MTQQLRLIMADEIVERLMSQKPAAAVRGGGSTAAGGGAGSAYEEEAAAAAGPAPERVLEGQELPLLSGKKFHCFLSHDWVRLPTTHALLRSSCGYAWTMLRRAAVTSASSCMSSDA